MSAPGVGRLALAAAAAVLVGVAKTGIPGFGILAVPLMVLAVGDARRSAGWLLPLLCVADLFAIAAYRRHAQATRLFALLPWVLAGMGAGALALTAPERTLRIVVAAIVIVMLGLRWLRERASRTSATDGAIAGGLARDRWWQSAGYGASAGFATTVANAAGPVMNLYLLARRLPKQEFVATGAWFFFVVNLVKLPVYAVHGLIDRRSLSYDAMLIPAVVAGALLGRTVLRRLPQGAFESLVTLLTVAAAALLLL